MTINGFPRLTLFMGFNTHLKKETSFRKGRGFFISVNRSWEP
jgi:hypothetical protein